MRRRSLITFIFLNVLITLAVVYAATTLLNTGSPPSTTNQVVITVPILVTATTDPNLTPNVRIITATPQPGTVILPTGIVDASSALTATIPLSTFDAQSLSATGADGQPVPASTLLPDGCIIHTLVSGDTPFGIAVQYGADPFRLMEVNGLDDVAASLLQIGDTLIVPLENCPLSGPITTPAPTLDETPTVESGLAEATAEATAEVTPTPTLRPTLTLPPTAANAQVEIAEVVGAGNINTEGIIIRNNGNNVNLKDWKLSDSQGNTYTFTERILFSNGLVTIYSRVGQDTAIALFWNRTQPAFEPGDVVTLTDNQGRVQGSFRLPAPVTLP